MNICFIIDNPETTKHPVVGAVLRQLSSTHTVRLFDVAGVTAAAAIAGEEGRPLADIYLLKSHTFQALELAHRLEKRGALVVNSFLSSLACQDRVLMAERTAQARLPYPPTRSFASLQEMLRQPSALRTVSFPLILKSRHSHRGDLVTKVHSIEQLRALAERWNQEPVILQEFVQGDGWDIKLWVIDEQIFAARRRTSLEADASKENFPISTEELPIAWRSLALQIGRVFVLHLYGIDLVVTEQGPVIVDINSFPGFRGVAGAAPALVSLIERLADAHWKGIP